MELKIKAQDKVLYSNTIPSHWHIKDIGELIHESREANQPAYPLLSVTRKNGVMSQEDSAKRDVSAKDKSKYKVLRPNWLVYNTMRMWQGVSAISHTTGIVSPAYTVCSINSDQLFPEFVGHLFKTPWMINQFYRHSQGMVSDTLNLKYEHFSKLKIVVPPLKEQIKISEILTMADEQVKLTDELIEKNVELKKGLMRKLLHEGIAQTEFKQTEFGEIPIKWKMKKVGDLYTFQGGQQPPKKYFSNEFKEGYIRLIQIRDYKNDKNEVFIPRHLAKRFCDETDIMIGRYGPPVFQILRGLSGSYNVALIKAVPEEKILLKEYAYYFLCKDDLFRLIDQLSQRSSGQTGVDMEALKNFPFPLPPLDEQGKIVDVLKAIDEQLDIYIKEKEKQIELKKALMQQLLTGKIQVTV